MTLSVVVVIRKLKFRFGPIERLAVKLYSTKFEENQCFSILGIEKDSDQETARQAFLRLVKKYHPDSGHPEANEQKFQEVEAAYRQIQIKFANERYNVNEGAGEYGLYYTEKKEEIKEFDIKHTAPQHRQYLNYGGVGSGTPSQREKQYSSFRAAKAVENVHQYRVNKLQDPSEQALIKKDTRRRAKDIKTGIGMDRLVEDLIQESMAKGEFDNLSGSGKPLKMKTHENPYVDFVTHKINQVLIDNGFIPTWILYQKDIREMSSKVSGFLCKERSKLGPNPLTEGESIAWKKITDSLRDDVNVLNDKINTYNLMVPILRKQMLQFDLAKESERILKEGEYKKTEKKIEVETSIPKEKDYLRNTFSAFLRNFHTTK